MKVVCLFNRTEAAQTAFKWYLNKMHQDEDEVHIFHAILTKEKIRKTEAEKDSFDDQIKDLDFQIDQISKLYSSKNIEVTKTLELVDKTSQIGKKVVAYCDSIQADLIVTGTRNRSVMERTFTGSVSCYVIRHANCPVFVCKELEELWIDHNHNHLATQ